ncbi:cathepsin d [Plakobranchus ocellatus]|uniref:Cathepsin d n=1 Tax=Plakobranchus ocellatus TaxID=259542 RepID=A0AAV3YQ63_9GAST|nr:cathepsin d [Plakobranchus ocellatus]
MNLPPAVVLLLVLVSICAAQIVSLPFSSASRVPWQHRNFRKVLQPRPMSESLQRPIRPFSKPYQKPIRDFRTKATTRDIKLENYYNRLYSASITLGTPGQEFYVAIDTKTPVTWIPSKHSPYRRIQSLSTGASKEYNNESSSTYTPNGKPFEVTYDSGQVSGYRSQDNMVIGGATVYNQVFGEAIRKPQMFGDSINNGILGMGFSGFMAGEDVTVVDNMYSQGLLPAPVFSTFFNRYGFNGSDSVLTLGGTNPEYYIGDFAFVYVNRPDRWQFEIDRIQVSNDPFVWHQCQAIVDTCSPFIVGPSFEVDRLNKMLGATPLERDPKIYTFESSQLNSLPDLEFVVNGQKLIMTGNDYAAQNIKLLSNHHNAVTAAPVADDTGIAAHSIADPFTADPITAVPVTADPGTADPVAGLLSLVLLLLVSSWDTGSSISVLSLLIIHRWT